MKMIYLYLRFSVILTLFGTSFLNPLFAHEGHNKVETQGFDLDAPRKISPETATLIGVKLAEVDFGAIESVVHLTGMVRPLPNRVQAVTSLVAGAIKSVHVQVGDMVRTGNPLIEIASPDYLKLRTEVVQSKWRIMQLEAELEARREQAEVAKLEFTRVSSNADVVTANLLSEKRSTEITTRSEVSRIEIEIRQAQAGLDAMKQLVGEIEQGKAHESGRLILHALFDGVVTERNAVIGAGVQAGETLLRVADYKTMQVDAEVPESLLPRLSSSIGNKVRIRPKSNGDLVVDGMVRMISPVVDPVKHTAHLIIETDNTTGILFDGMFVEATVVLREEKNAVVVPVSALFKDGPITFVFIQDSEAYIKKNVLSGVRDDQFVEILEGLAPGDMVVIAGGYSLSQIRPKSLVKNAETINPAPPANDGHGHSH